MSVKKILTFIVLLHLCSAQNILNYLDFAAPLFGILKSGTPEVCYNDLGCFRNDGPFTRSPSRPISCVPQSPQIIGTEFLFFSRRFSEEPEVIEALDSHLFDQVDFNPNKKTKFVIHGYKEGLLIHGFSHDKYEAIKDALLHNEDSNVILVRWSRGASGFYFQSVANTRVVAAQIAELINYLISERKARPESFHLIGFSLGAHISGYVGKLVKGLGKITALDTAKPYFDGVPKIARIDRTDALYIEAFHTDNGMGTEAKIGTIDIYFNGGNRQPGCNQVMETIESNGIVDGLLETISCDHKRALHYYVDYLFRANSECIPVAYRCRNWDQFTSGLCATCGQNGEKCIVVGINTELNSRLSQQTDDNKYFILTSDRQPFCVHQYLVRIATQWNKSTIDGEFHIRFHSHNNTFKDHKSRHLERLSENEVSFIISTESPLKQIRKIDLTFIKGTISEESPQNSVLINSMKLIPLNIIDDNEKIRNSVTYCTPNNQWLSHSHQNVISLRSVNCI